MSDIQELSPYRQKVQEVKHRLWDEGSDFTQWGKDNGGYTQNQMYATTRRERVSKFGISREIALKLGLIEGESHA